MASNINNERPITTTVDFAEISKVRFFTIGTFVYSGLTTILHPASVIKVRQQVLGSAGNHIHIRTALAHAVTRLQFEGIRQLYRGVGVVLSLAIPARVVYITTLEGTRLGLSSLLSGHLSPTTATTLSAGMAGGLAAVSAQLIVVPMDIISQRQMVSFEPKSPRFNSIVQSILSSPEGIRGLYRGFGISLFASLPTGTLWWATYAACQEKVNKLVHGNDNRDYVLHPTVGLIASQLTSGVSAAVVAATISQPLDVVKTRLQVAEGSISSADLNYRGVVLNLYRESGFLGFFKGMIPRMVHMSLWGTVLASAYEFLKYISRHPQVLTDEESTAIEAQRRAQLARRVTKITIQSNMY